MFAYYAYILIGNDKTGKTSFQKYLIQEICDRRYDKLPRNKSLDIKNTRIPAGFDKIFLMNRSYQEKIQEYKTVKNFFDKFFKEENICILSSHCKGSSIDDIKNMITELRTRSYNVSAVFFSNGYDDDAKQISLLDWQERLWIENPPSKSETSIQQQIAKSAKEFSQMLLRRAAYL